MNVPLPEEIRTTIFDYCVRDLPGPIQWHIDQFSFIEDEELSTRLGRAFYSARFIAKLSEGTSADGGYEHPFIKFQVIQYASIYEAVITYLLRIDYADHDAVKRMRTYRALKRVQGAFSHLTEIKYNGMTLLPSVMADKTSDWNSIPFAKKVDCAVEIGLVDVLYAEDIKNTYSLRNLAHIENEAAKQIEIELADAKMGYWRLQPFLDRIRETLPAHDIGKN